ncbi:N-acetylmuramoyl-L-alanine amidase [Bombiscardovia nodaiensis]|uniref:N-acetylmuramoyl-L-alanine amidase n=1 Tax=Bombiscardovia nodaiensis TaxID=2932181 RepID=A0ABN6SAS1_9BIFI|nr:N-acetylmuramoyl-L-alanine amidase [Bombiscardovia nodaiensis]
MMFAADQAKAVRGAHITKQRVPKSQSPRTNGGSVINVSEFFRQESRSLQASAAVDDALAQKLNQVAPPSRRSRRMAAKAAARKNHLMTGSAMTALVGAVAGAVAVVTPKSPTRAPLADAAGSSQITPASYAGGHSGLSNGSQVSRSEVRSHLREQQTSNHGSWELDEYGLDVDQMFKSLADNPLVAQFMGQDQSLLPASFNPNHATGDSGNAYEFSQCTWWAYTRRHQLGLPVGSHMGNGAQWASSAKALGYWVDNTPRHVGDVMVFKPGQEGTDAQYGHVAIVEAINADGSVTTSESGVSLAGKTYSHTFKNVNDFQYIHY